MTSLQSTNQTEYKPRFVLHAVELTASLFEKGGLKRISYSGCERSVCSPHAAQRNAGFTGFDDPGFCFEAVTEFLVGHAKPVLFFALLRLCVRLSFLLTLQQGRFCVLTPFFPHAKPQRRKGRAKALVCVSRTEYFYSLFASSELRKEVL
jgi:hypothetical protein